MGKLKNKTRKLMSGHSALNEKTPSEVAGIDLSLGKNKWVGLIEKTLSVETPTGDNHQSNLLTEPNFGGIILYNKLPFCHRSKN